MADGGGRFVDPFGASASHHGSFEPMMRNGVATAAMTVGIIAVVLAWIPFVVVIGSVMGLIALVLGIRGLRRSNTAGTGRGFAITGILTGAAALLLSVIGVIFTVVVYREVVAFIDPGPVQAMVASCESNARVTVQGDITNQSDRTRDYTLFVTVSPVGADGTERTTGEEIDDVPPGATVRWLATAPAFDSPGNCEAEVVVQGPYPFGVEIDAIDG